MKSMLMFLILGAILLAPVSGQYKRGLIATSDGELEIFYIGHASLMFTFNGLVIHVDTVMREADAALAIKSEILYAYHCGETDPQKLVELLKDEKDIEVRVRDLN